MTTLIRRFRHWLILQLVGRGSLAVNLWFDPHNGLMVSGLRDSFLRNVTVRDCRRDFTILGVLECGP